MLRLNTQITIKKLLNEINFSLTGRDVIEIRLIVTKTIHEKAEIIKDVFGTTGPNSIMVDSVTRFGEILPFWQNLQSL